MPDRSFDQTGQRTCMVAQLTEADLGREVRLCGWVHRRRDLGGLVFVDLRDRSGIMQLSFGPDWTAGGGLASAGRLGLEDVIAVQGVVSARPPDARNPDMATGAVEVRVRDLEVLNPADVPPIPVYRGPEDELPSEDLRLQHRVLDLRREQLQRNLILRHRLILEARNVFDRLGFIEIETPILTKPTPEGARDFLVPSRIHPGHFYALPQSPQIYKQLLIAAGFDRYVQIPRCFRDEDARADRQPEFTQIDLEAAFVEPDDVLACVEEVLAALAGVAGIPANPPFTRMTWAEAMERYGSDRPDLRIDLEIENWTDVLSATESDILRRAVADGGRVRGLRVPGGARLSRREIEEVEAASKKEGAPGLLWAKVGSDGASGPLGRFLVAEHLAALKAVDGDLLLAAAGPDAITSPALAAARTAVASAAELPRATEHAWAWVVEFPVFERAEDGSITPNHHPFVLPHPDDVDRLASDPLSVRGFAYDVVYNGSELGSGSIRNHRSDLQRRIFRVLGLTEDEMDRKFGFLLSALDSGAPPHGGMALGMDRIVQRFVGAESLRDVIAFPKTTAARALFEGAPTRVAEEELRALHIRLST